MESGNCDALLVIALLLNPDNKSIVRFEQQVGFETIKYSRTEMLKKPLIDIMAMTATSRVRYILEPIEDKIITSKTQLT